MARKGEVGRNEVEKTVKNWLVVEFQPLWKIYAQVKFGWVHLPRFSGVKNFKKNMKPESPWKTPCYEEVPWSHHGGGKTQFSPMNQDSLFFTACQQLKSSWLTVPTSWIIRTLYQPTFWYRQAISFDLKVYFMTIIVLVSVCFSFALFSWPENLIQFL